MIIERRSFLKGISALFIAPAIVRASSLMPVHEMMPSIPAWCPDGWLPLDGREIKKKFYPDLYSAYERMRFPMRVGTDQIYETPHGYSPTGLLPEPQFARIISARDMRKANGEIMRAGVTSTILLPAA